MSVSWPGIWPQLKAQSTRRLLGFLAVLVVAWLVFSPFTAQAFVGLGDYLSEKIVGTSNVNNILRVGRTATDNPLVVATGPTVTTDPATAITFTGGVNSAALNGNLTNLNGMPQADVWFVWGYGPGALSNTTATTTVAATGTQSTTITGYNSGTTVFYQFHASTDGTVAGATRSFAGATGAGTMLMNRILPIIIAASMLILTLMLTKNLVAALLAALIGAVGFYLVQTVIPLL